MALYPAVELEDLNKKVIYLGFITLELAVLLVKIENVPHSVFI
jgi:hypothetical protein